MSLSGTAAAYFGLVTSQRAQRELKPDPVPEELIGQILTAATHAPSAMNSQPWRFVVAQSPSIRQAIAHGARAAWEGFARGMTKDQTPPGFKAVDQWATSGLAKAPVIIVLCGGTHVLPLEQMGSSIFPAAQNILLAANALGLASLMSNLPISAPDSPFAKVLELPEHVVPLAPLPIGYPARELGKPRRKPIGEVTSRDRFGGRW